jgi:hypothetical protein
MKYYKFIAKKDTWFKEGSEVFYEDSNYRCKRVDYETLQLIKQDNPFNVFRGIRVCSYEYEFNLGFSRGQERFDGEACSLDEFDIIETEEYREI